MLEVGVVLPKQAQEICFFSHQLLGKFRKHLVR
jgi:hypothetical protein